MSNFDFDKYKNSYDKVTVSDERKEEIIDFFTINKENMFSKQNESILFPIGD